MPEAFLREFEQCLEMPQGTVAPEMLLSDIEKFDSMGRLNVIAMADSRFGVVLSPEAIDKCLTVGDLADICSTR